MRACHLLIGLVAVVLAGGAGAGPAHEHGVARLDVAVDPGRVVLALDTPLDNLLGFEHAPRTDAEREKAAAMVARLRAADQLFRIDAAAGCTLARVVLDAPALGLGRGAAPGAAQVADKEGHADLEAQFEFTCKAGARAGFLEQGLFEAFAPLKRLELQVATPRGQMKATLRRPQSRLALAR
jgi:hypothetical protein